MRSQPTSYTRHFVLVALLLCALVTSSAAHTPIDVVASNWRFTPSAITVAAGQTTTLRLTSTSGTHGIASPELGIAATTIQPGQFVEVSFNPSTAGTFAVHCSIFCGAGHADMVLTVIVTGGAAATPASTPVAMPAATMTPAPTPKPTMKPTPKPMIDDRHFIFAMVHHDRMGLQMAQAARKSAQRSEIRAFAKALGSRDGTAIAQLRHWYKMWYGSSVPDMPPMDAHPMPHMGMDMMHGMSSMSLSGAPDVDRAFLVGTIGHESMGASLALAAEQGLAHAELRAYARSSAAAQFNDVQQLWRWYKQWYPKP